VGSLLAGTKDDIDRGRLFRKRLGGGMRQAGILAAAGLYALEHNIGRLADDHRRARLLAERLTRVPGLRVDLGKVQTNMVYAGTRESGTPAADLVRHLAEAGVWCLDEGPWTIRLVAHLDVDDADVEEAGELVASVVERLIG
jgi:threonine aldolase